MGKYRITSPDGQKYEITAPDDATEEQILSYAKENMPRRSPSEMALEGMSVTQKFLAGAGKAMTDVGRGVGQLVGAVSNEDVAESRRRDEAISRTGAGKAGEIAGGVATALPTMFIPGANTIVGAGLIGGAYGAIQPATSGGERLGNISLSGLGSSAITGGVRGVPSLYKALVSPFTNQGQERIALDTISRFSKDKNALSLSNVDELIPGSKPTLAEVTGDPGIAQLQRAAQAASPETASLMAENKTARLLARKDALLNMGKADDKEFFEAAREATANRLYGDAFKKTLDPDKVKAVAPDVKELLARPSIQSAKQEAMKLAKEGGEILRPSDMRGGSLRGLHYMKMAVDDQISVAKRAGDNNKVRLLMGTKDKLIGVLQKISPKYAEAMAEYQAGSKPINQMEITQYLYNKLVPAMTDLGAERLNSNAFANALREGDKMAQTATGFRGAKLFDILTTDQVNTLVNLGKDLAREAASIEKAKVPGSPTAQYLAGRNAIRQVLGPLGLPEKWSESILADTLGGRALSALAAPSENAVQSTLGRFLTDPAAAKAAQERLSSSNRKMIPLSDLAKRILPPVSTAGGSAYANQQ